MKRFLARHQPPPCRPCAVKAGLGALAGLAFIAWLGREWDMPLLIAPFGATCVLVFAVPESPLAQPANVIGGHAVATVLSLILATLLPPETWWGPALAVGVVITVTALLRLTHPPAGADPLVILPAGPGPEFLLTPVLAGTVALVGLAMLVHRLPPRAAYPLPARPRQR